MKRLIHRGYSLLAGLVLALSLAHSPASAQVEILEEPVAGRGVAFFRIMVRAGSMHDPKGKEGLANFTAMLLKRGAGKWDRKAIDERLDQRGASLDAYVQKEFTMIVGRCLTANLPEFYDLLRAVVLEPSFPTAQVQSGKQDQLEAINAVKNDNEDLGLEAFTHFVYAGTSWEHSAVGRVSSVNSFTRQDVVEFYNTRYTRDNVTVGIGGDYGTDGKLVEKIRADFGKLPQRSVPTAVPPRPELKGRRVLIVEKRGLDQGQINIGHPLSIHRKDATYAPLYVAAQYLGSHRTFTGQLMKSVRSDRGLTYGAYSYIEYFPYPYRTGAEILPMMNIARSQQDFRVWTFTLAKNIDFTLRLALLKFIELRRDGVDKRRFASVKTYSKNKFVFFRETPERRLAMRLDDKIYGTGDFGSGFEARLAKVTAADTNAVMRAVLDPDDLAIVVTVPDAAAFKAELLKPGASVEYQGNIDPAPLTTEDGQAKGLDLKLSEESIVIKGVDALFE